MHEQTVSYDDLVKYAALDREEIFITDILEHKYEKEGNKDVLWLRTRYHDGSEWWNRWQDLRNTACAQWYVLTVPELTHHGKHLFANAAERKEKYSELRARFAKDSHPQKKEEDAQMEKNRQPIANPEQPKLPQVSFDEQAETSVKHSLERVFEGRRRRRPRVTFKTQDKGNKQGTERKLVKLEKQNIDTKDTKTKNAEIVEITKRSTGEKKYITRERLDKYLQYIQEKRDKENEQVI